MTRQLMILAAVVAALASVPMSGQAQTRPAAGVRAARPQAPDKPLVDHVKDLIDQYQENDERGRFFEAAGVDGEISKEEFSAAAAKDRSFVRSYDRWDAAVVHDLDENGKLNWPEAEKYRLGVKELVLAQYDKNKDGKLTGEERDAANRMLERGLRRPRGRSWSVARWDKDNDGKLSEEERSAMATDGARWQKAVEEWTKRWDKDGDGKLSREEQQAAAKTMRQEYEKQLLEKWDANKDGKLDDDEKQAMRDAWRKQMQERMEKYLTRRHDKDGDGQLNEQERAAADAEREQWRQRREEWRKRSEEWAKRLDTDGDGEISEEERGAAVEKALAEWEKRRKEMDTDGDGNVSREERQNYWKQLQKKYDADGDGKLNEEERKKMIETEAGSFMGRR